ncbi:MAG: peptide ABC transporter substrate-binding protein [Clostridia bacterium]|nr:peptide ABC transporter substrate-binding protein [Clostridia bacterium]
MLRKVLAMVVAASVFASAFVGCGSSDDKDSGNTSEKSTVSATVGPEPETIDPALNTSADGSIYLVHTFEGLTKVGSDGKTIAGAAKEWKISDDGLKYTFTIRDDAKWSDGKPVTAQDFEYAWKRALDPATASDYATQLYYLKNGEEFNQGKAKADDVGVKAKDEKTLEVDLKVPTVYFLDLTNFPTYFPVRKDIIEKYKDKWTQSAESYISNGAYKMTEWKHNAEIVMTLNENYWDKKDIKIKEIHWKLTDDHAAALNAFESGEHDFNDGQVPTEEFPKLIADGKTTPVNELGVNAVVLNVNKAPVNDLKVRKALSLAIDRKFIVEKVQRGGQKTAVGFVPYGMPGLDTAKDFRTEAGAESYFTETADIEGAKKLLAEAGYPEGKGLPEIEYSNNTNAVNNKLAEALQEQWAKIGVKAKISNMEWSVFIPYRQEKKHTIARYSWSGDYMDPMTFMDIWLTGNGNNDSGWSNKEYDSLIAEAKSTNDQAKRMAALHKAEKILMEELPVIPISYRLKNSLVNPKLKGVYQNPLGQVFFHYAYWEK